MTWFKKTESAVTVFVKDVCEKLWRNWSGFAAIAAKYYLPRLHLAPSLETILDLILTFLIVAVGANIAKFILSNLKWTATKDSDGKELPEFVIAANRIVIGLIFLSCSIIAASYYSQKDQTSTVSSMNEELQLKDSTVAKTIDSLKALPLDTLELLK